MFWKRPHTTYRYLSTYTVLKRFISLPQEQWTDRKRRMKKPFLIRNEKIRFSFERCFSSLSFFLSPLFSLPPFPPFSSHFLFCLYCFLSLKQIESKCSSAYRKEHTISRFRESAGKPGKYVALPWTPQNLLVEKFNCDN